MQKIKNHKIYLLALLLPFVLFVIGFELGPMMAMFKNSFYADDGIHLTMNQYITIFKSKFYLQAIKNSIVISIISAVISILIAVVTAYSFTKFSRKIQNRLLMIANVTSNFEGIPLSFSYIILLGNNGLFTLLFAKLGWNIFADFNLYSWTGLILVYIYFQIPLAILLIYPSFQGIKQQWKEASALLGGSTISFWLRIGIPVLLPSIVGTFSILFANAMGAYATAYALVGSNYNLLSLQIASLVSSDVTLKPQLGSALGVLLATTMIGAMWINERMMRRIRRDLR
ncbi:MULTISPECIES: ABC transporter permease subunit [Bacillaceae]|uniref:ABC transporter permease n=1 Tax=Bacillaceae TaxID=186817 RepID=UPI0008EBB574|nr:MULTISPECIES: ABC transporter permease subunit [Bacillaceae]PGZ90744.1 ABC transporter permease [Bacillus sp. AFS029533]SFD30081.1 putative spermidine/putrescine transport system permease protein [Bacillus sp. UNCCL81]